VRPQLVILDPATGGEGVRLVEAMRNLAAWRHLPVVALTDATDRPSVLKGRLS